MEKASFYFVSYKCLSDAEKCTKATLLSFSIDEICFQDIASVMLGEERNNSLVCVFPYFI